MSGLRTRPFQLHAPAGIAQREGPFSRHSWPGNISELQNLVERAVLLATSPLLHIRVEEDPRAAPSEPAPATLAALREANWVLTRPNGAAQRLGMKRSTLHWKMKKLHITRPG